MPEDKTEPQFTPNDDVEKTLIRDVEKAWGNLVNYRARARVYLEREKE